MATANPSEWANQAALDALLRYKPQREGLADLQRQAQEAFRAEVQAGKSEGTLGVQAAQGAVAPTQAAFTTAGTEDARTRALLAGTLSQLPQGSPLATATANEQAAGQERLAGGQARALADLQQRKVAATELPAFTRMAAQSRLAKALQTISGKQQMLSGSEGADLAAELGKMRGEAAKQATSENNDRLNRQTQREDTAANNRTSRSNNQENNQTRREKGAGSGGVKPLTQSEQNRGAALIAEISHYATEGGSSRAERVAALTEGRPQQSVKNAKGESVKVPKVPAFKPDALMSAGLDAAELGFLKPHTVHALEGQGYNVRAIAAQLGVGLNQPQNTEPPRAAAPGNHHGA